MLDEEWHDRIHPTRGHRPWRNLSDRPCRILFVLIDGKFDPGLVSA